MPMYGDKHEPRQPTDRAPWPWYAWASCAVMVFILTVALHAGDHLTVPWDWRITVGALTALIVGERILLKGRS